ncbi:Sin3 complex subunit [Moelleriella libera RCEF 2490]|uniref:Sin3 complex subunit n=1 Tax=Moelleriella libera RCEF 2490 TaxID=1081109 RepID=A0A162K278_9HYPO|nr:Sin3 complex subunit [Moelleriella libera RCEF 2490]
MTSSPGSALPLPPDQERDDELLFPPSRVASQRSSQEVSSDGTSGQGHARMRTGALTHSPAGSQIPQRRLIVPDPLTFRFLEDDPSVLVIERRCVLAGYELYLVEQWACSRQSPIIIVTTYTGDEKHVIVAGVVSVPRDPGSWSARLRFFFNTASQHNARPKHTELGELMITNLSSFPSALTVIAVPDGDVRRHREIFIVNEDLKRLGCSGRSGLALTEPTEATQAKFCQLYKTSDRLPIMQTVTELVKLCQVALFMFDKLDYQYIDGLLCDATEIAISNWWTEIGAEHYNFEPTDGILGPTTVSALLGMLMGARNRLHWFGAPVSKDVFDVEATKRGIAYFQKQQKLEKTRRLDRQTVFRLHTATAKGAAGEGWGVQKAVKSTVTEIGGKRGEIVMDMVAGRDKGGLADIETLDIDRFISLAYGDRPRWLWHGKARKAVGDVFPGDQDSSVMPIGKNDTAIAPSKRTQSLPLSDEAGPKRKEDVLPGQFAALPSAATTNLADISGERDALRRGVFKSVSDKMSDARSGLGRIKDAVGGSRRGHVSKLSVSTKEDVSEPGGDGATITSAVNGAAMASSPSMVGRTFTWKNKPEEYLAAFKRGEDVFPGQLDGPQSSEAPTKDLRSSEKTADDSSVAATAAERNMRIIGSDIRKDVRLKAASARQTRTDDEGGLRGPLLKREQEVGSKANVIARRRSCGVSDLGFGIEAEPNEARWPRRTSFGDAEEAVLGWEEVIDITDTADYAGCMNSHAGAANHLNYLIERMTLHVGPWAQDKVKDVQLIDQRYERDLQELQKLHARLNEAFQRVRYSSDELLSEQRENLTESVKEIEIQVARLEYEINGLIQKVHDVEDSVQNFERQVDHVESRAAELTAALGTESWFGWLARSLSGVGTRPNLRIES